MAWIGGAERALEDERKAFEAQVERRRTLELLAEMQRPEHQEQLAELSRLRAMQAAQERRAVHAAANEAKSQTLEQVKQLLQERKSMKIHGN